MKRGLCEEERLLFAQPFSFDFIPCGGMDVGMNANDYLCLTKH
ncbi:hypothetical protein HMPREF1990_00972 [Porphyromonas gingivalis W4087]|uniref:Uncharacterized protein n=1 Tax=Porphyromonas gingivalis F0570 TaxID=1227271 RepID=A0A0E2LSH6_PORGN|nr:hypothetical protein HMPREF1553_01687 [Porphyromonas gingivalis F0568]ERJ68094.1 hypothetical protein HMPREF1555_00576 [Porphyromonas gingivalis F0570]ERJ89276.1 hypothetical protein HMPREF1990_00972 [Porphyromonas gingivalis W4087]